MKANKHIGPFYLSAASKMFNSYRRSCYWYFLESLQLCELKTVIGGRSMLFSGLMGWQERRSHLQREKLFSTYYQSLVTGSMWIILWDYLISWRRIFTPKA